MALTPFSYLVNSHRSARREVLAPGGPSRGDAGFAKDDLVLACFNQARLRPRPRPARREHPARPHRALRRPRRLCLRCPHTAAPSAGAGRG